MEDQLPEAERTEQPELPGDPAGRLRTVVQAVVAELDPEATVEVTETEETLTATVVGGEPSLLIGRHGVTIDAIQHIAARAAFRGAGERKAVVVDAAGYRARREATLIRAADRAVADALSFERPIELDPMSAPERRIVHTYLKDRTDVQTHSEGEEPERRLVVTPVGRA
jgi:spoIIIJ-associated protein